MPTVVVDIERRLAVGPAEARAALVRFLRAEEFTITAEQVSMVSAKRGSQIVGSVQPRKLPVSLHATLTPTETGCTVNVTMSDAWRSPVGKVWGMNGPYTTLMTSLQASLDAALAPLAEAGASFDAPVVTSATRDILLLSATNAVAVKGGGVLAEKVDDLLTPGDHRSTPKALKEVVLRSSKGAASFDRMGVEGLFTVGLLVSSKPGSMPPNLGREVEALSAKIEARVASQPQGRVVCELSDEEIPVAEFLGKQAAIRSELPLRTLHVCTTCKFEKIVNPDFEKLQEKNRRKQILTGAVGATITPRGVSPFFLVGTLMRFKNFNIPFVCPRCQGLEADSSVVTYCPNCGERRDEAVLRSCRRCNHNFGAAHQARHAEFWGPDEPDPVAPPIVAMAPPAVSPPPMGPVAAFAPPPVGTPVNGAAVASPPVSASANGALAAPPVVAAPAPAPPARWHDDPTGRHQHRYWDGVRWTEHVSDRGVQGVDPV